MTPADRPAILSAVLARVARHLDTLPDESISAALTQPTDRSVVEHLAGVAPKPRPEDPFRALPASDAYVILGDRLWTNGVFDVTDAPRKDGSYRIAYNGRLLLPRRILNVDNQPHGAIDRLWVVAQGVGLSDIGFFWWLTSPNLRLPGGAIPLLVLEECGYGEERPAFDAVERALATRGEMGA